MNVPQLLKVKVKELGRVEICPADVLAYSDLYKKMTVSVPPAIEQRLREWMDSPPLKQQKGKYIIPVNVREDGALEVKVNLKKSVLPLDFEDHTTISFTLYAEAYNFIGSEGKRLMGVVFRADDVETVDFTQ